VGERATRKKTALIAANIDDYLEEISELRRKVTIREDLARDAEARRFSLRPADATDKLLRYEAHLDRQLYRAMDQLERLQRQRRGENVPPPLNINLGRRR
jgi:CRISPR/Cas system-associated endonuclease Cas1